MLNNLVTSLFTPCSSYIRRMGYLSEAIDMRRRSRRHAAAWSSHLERSRAFLLAAAKRCAGGDRITVIGSGLLLDVPLAELCSLFHEVVLTDVVCLLDVRRHIRCFPNAHFIEHDATGMAHTLCRSGEKGVNELPVPVQELPTLVRESSLVVSLNILSQLWVVPRAYVSRTMQGLDEYAVDEWCGSIVAAHYAAIRSLAGDVCLIADHSFVKRDTTGSVVSRGSSVYGLELPTPDTTWNWNIVPPDGGTVTVSKELIVGAWYFNRS